MRERAVDELADEIGALSDRAVNLAEALEAAEAEAAAIARECERLGVAGRVTDSLTALQRIPSGAAEALQDELDRIAGGLHHPPANGDGAPAHSPTVEVAAPTHEHLSVVCPNCGQHIGVGAVDADAADLSLEGRSYRCPRCGHVDRYETWDHRVDDDASA